MVVVLAFVAYLAWSAPGRSSSSSRAVPELGASLVGLAVVGVLGAAVNDQGIVGAATLVVLVGADRAGGPGRAGHEPTDVLFSHGCIHGVAGHPSAAAMSGNAVAPSISSRTMSAWPVWRAGLLHEVEQHPADVPRVEVVGEPRDALRDGHRLEQVGDPADDRLGLARDVVVAREHLGEGLVGSHPEVVGVVGRPGVGVGPDARPRCRSTRPRRRRRA